MQLPGLLSAEFHLLNTVIANTFSSKGCHMMPLCLFVAFFSGSHWSLEKKVYSLTSWRVVAKTVLCRRPYDYCCCNQDI